jgi:hypothetical protein
MPRYFFMVRTGDREASERAAELNDDAAALAYACDIARELAQMGALIGNPDLMVKVRDETRPMVFSGPSLAACA